MRATVHDPRDVTDEDDHPAYRVEFWIGSTQAEEWRLVDVDSVEEVLAWVRTRADGRSAVVGVEHRCGEGIAVARLLGRAPA
ncbi:hypothetical protein [Cellulomonas shaoxiangyii]|uniref:Uncharacterized protein n=1 Tax=Cellulomonas shaoxiangyii TaxID=2566013 RepID=A0A4P7SHC2_9CELL|nr:hypothetical protein [Cellulomonas shaoxiangyii]QCB93360.1 hypothetical protein E5225_07130 [Cellulomonas shaoxiangyii]TGY85322.1 hypothetical protein E5226_07055 [Cellulomonas shaoxiangyii]